MLQAAYSSISGDGQHLEMSNSFEAPAVGQACRFENCR
jgi:hypothetical protein